VRVTRGSRKNVKLFLREPLVGSLDPFVLIAAKIMKLPAGDWTLRRYRCRKDHDASMPIAAQKNVNSRFYTLDGNLCDHGSFVPVCSMLRQVQFRYRSG